MTATLNYVVTTGDHIVEWMEDEGINAAELARRLGVTPKHVSELLSGKAPLSHPMALALESVTGIPARIWNLYETNYRGQLASHTANEDLADQYKEAKAFPLAYLRKFGFITASARDHAATVRQLLSLLGVASIEARLVGRIRAGVRRCRKVERVKQVDDQRQMLAQQPMEVILGTQRYVEDIRAA